jgi:hypothetical protein
MMLLQVYTVEVGCLLQMHKQGASRDCASSSSRRQHRVLRQQDSSQIRPDVQ